MTNVLKPPCDVGVIQATPEVAPKTPKERHPWVLLATILGSSMAFIDGTVVNVALPVLQEDLRATVADVQWVVEAYALFLAALILVGGSLGDRFGRKRIFALGIGLFTLASLTCGLAPNITFLIFARAVQGIGAALLTPGSLALISASFSSDERGRAIGTWSGFTSITSALGPVIGGWLIEHGTWRLIFFLNVPLAALVLAILFWRVPESRAEQNNHHLDWPGAALATLGLGAVVYGLITSSTLGLGAPEVLLSLVLGIVALIVFLFVEARSPAPMLPLPLFRSPTFSGANLLTLFLYAATGATTFFVPFNLIRAQGYSATAAGAAFLPFILLMFILSRWSGGLVTRFGAKLPLVVGPLIAGVGFLLFAVPGVGGSYWTTFFPAIIVLGLGMSIAVAPLTTAVMGAAGPDHAGIASGINNAVARTASLLAIAVLGIVILAVFNGALDSHLAMLHISPETRHLLDPERVKLAGAQVPPGVPATLHVALQQAITDSFVSGFRVVMVVCSGLAVAAAIAAGVLISGKKPGGENEKAAG